MRPDHIRATCLSCTILIDDRHRLQRKLLSPAFGPAQLRQITPTFYAVAHRVRSVRFASLVELMEHCQLRQALLTEVGSSRKKLDMLDWSARVTLEVMGQAAFGTSFDPLTEEDHAPISSALKVFV